MSSFTYGDSCQTGDDKYVIAQFRSDASLDWVADLRAFLMKDELKYKWFNPERHRVMAKADLWKRVQDGVHQAEITILDPRRYAEFAMAEYLEEQAVPGIDFDTRAINEKSGRYLIEGSPLGAVSAFEYDWLADNTRYYDGYVSGDGGVHIGGRFSADSVKQRAGGKLHDAIVVAARSHAMLAPSEMNEIMRSCFGYGGMDYASGMDLIKRMTRVFDVEHPKSIPILNEFSERLAHAVGIPHSVSRAIRRKGIVSEAGSHDIDHIQAADLAAGWAVDLLTLTNGDYRTLAQRFAWVGVNGVLVPS